MAERERDPYTGIMTTGHEWNGIKELMTPVPATVKFFLSASILCAVLLWILFPTWPYGSGYTKGVLGTDQRTVIDAELATSASLRASWEEKLNKSDFTALKADPEVANLVRMHGARLFEDNCSMCHGTDGTGGPGFPNLTDDQWLWGNDAEAILETLRVGINTAHDETRTSEMLAFGDQGMLELGDRRAVSAYVRSLSRESETAQAAGDNLASGKEIFAENCASCHGDDAKGNRELGAPNLTDNYWIYGGDAKSVAETLRHGRKGVMPYWEQRLSETDRKLLTLFVVDLGKNGQ